MLIANDNDKSWRGYFLSKRKMLLGLNYTDEQILSKFERDLKEHEATMPAWEARNMGGKKQNLINGLKGAIYRIKMDISEGEQLKMF